MKNEEIVVGLCVYCCVECCVASTNNVLSSNTAKSMNSPLEYLQLQLGRHWNRELQGYILLEGGMRLQIVLSWQSLQDQQDLLS